MIDINSVFLKEVATSEGILKYVSEYELFRSYVKEFKTVGKLIKSPLREDGNPSFNIFYSKINNKLMFKDLGSGQSGDCFNFISRLYNCNLWETYALVIKDFKLEEHFYYGECRNASIIVPYKATKEELDCSKQSEVDLRITSRAFTARDFKYWKLFGITGTGLSKYKVRAISHLHLNGHVYKTEEFAYAYPEWKDEHRTYKIYQPFNIKYKWFTTHTSDIHQGYAQLPARGELLIITKSLKDVMAIDENLSIPSVAVQAESVYIKPSVMQEYKQRFEKVIVLFDNDKQGIEFSNKYSELYRIPKILIPDHYKCKDYSDLIRENGTFKASEILTNLINTV